MNKINPRKSAILVIDMEKAFVEPGAALCIEGAKVTVPIIADAIECVRNHGVKVFWVKRVYKEDGSDMEAARRKKLFAKGLYGVLSMSMEGLNSTEEPEGLKIEPEDDVVIKPRYSAFFGTDLKVRLDQSGIDTLLITGTTTPNCIRATVYDALSYDYRTIVLESCCSSMDDFIQEANIKDMDNVGAEIFYGEDYEELF